MRILTRYFRRLADRQDLSQEVFLRIFTRMRDLRDHGALRAFVVNICLGVAQNELRRRYARRGLGLSETGAMPDHPVAGADFEARQAIARYDQVLSCLAGDDRAAFVLRHIEKKTVAEVAAAVAWSRSKTKRRLTRVTARVARLVRHDPAIAAYATCFNAARAA